MSDRDVDAQFADIIAHWDDVAPLPDRGPDAPETNEPPTNEPPSNEPPTALSGLDDLRGLDDLSGLDPEGDDPSGSRARPDDPPPPARPLGVNPSPLRDNPSPLADIPVWRGATSGAVPGRAGARDANGWADDEDEHFHPGPTAPLPPQEDIHFWGIVVGLVAGPLLLLWQVIFHGSDLSTWWVLGSLGLTVMGFVLLVLRQPKSRDEDDPDDGARV